MFIDLTYKSSKLVKILGEDREVFSVQAVFMVFFSSSSATVSPKQWENISDLNIARAEQQKNNSLSLRALVESLLAQSADDMQKQFRSTNEALQLNIQLLKAAKTQLEDKLPKVGLNVRFI